MTHEEPELTPGEREALGRLPRERLPGILVEERLIRRLRDEGLIEAGRRRRWWTPQRFLVGAAAAAMLFLGGVATGQWLATRQAGQTIAAMNRDNALQAAALVQRTGTAYASAIGALASMPDSGATGSVAQGREVALNALYAAANELVRLAPDDPVVVQILASLDRRRSEGRPDTDNNTVRRVVWF